MLTANFSRLKVFLWLAIGAFACVPVQAVDFSVLNQYRGNDAQRNAAGGGGTYSGPSQAQIAAQQAEQARQEAARQAELARQQTLKEAATANDQGVALLNQRDWASAIESFQQAIGKDPNNQTYRDHLADAQAHLKTQQQDIAAASQMQQTIQAFTQTLNPAPSTGGLDFDGRNAGSAPKVSGLDFTSAGSSAQPAAALTFGDPAPRAPALSFGDAMVVDARGVSSGLPKSVEDAIPHTPSGDRVRKGLEAIQTHDWKVALACFQDALNKAPGDPGLERLVDLAQSTLDRESQGKLTFADASAPQAPAPVSPSTAPAQPEKRLPAQVQAQIKVIQQALIGLNNSMKLDPAQRKEWEEKSESATRDSYNMVSGSLLDLLGAHLDHELKSADAELKRGEDILFGETNPDRRAQLHTAFAVLKARRDELDHAKNVVEVAKLGDDYRSAAIKGIIGDDRGKLEKAYEACGAAHLLPPGAGEAKTLIDAYYNVAVQTISVEQIYLVNAHSDQYLQAVNDLSKKMQDVVQGRPSAAPAKPAPVVPPSEDFAVLPSDGTYHATPAPPAAP